MGAVDRAILAPWLILDLSESSSPTGMPGRPNHVSALVGCRCRCGGGIYDPLDRSAKGELWPGVLFVAVPMMFAVRGFALGLVIVGDKVISRGWFRTRTIPRTDVSAVRAVNYSGYWNRHGSSIFFLMLKLEVAGRDVEIPAVAGRSVTVHRLASQMGDVLGLVRRSAQTSAHRNQG